MKRIVVFFGLAGSGKSTLALTLSKSRNYYYVSPSNVLQTVAETYNSAESDIVRESLRNGTLFPDTLFNKLIADHFNRRETDKIIFDGYPRTQSTAREFERLAYSHGFKAENIYAIYTSATEEEALQRYLQRNRIGDDNAKRWYERFKLFQENELPLISEYSNKFHYLCIKASDPLSDNVKYVLDYLDE